jgi:hypothetical protein
MGKEAKMTIAMIRTKFAFISPPLSYKRIVIVYTALAVHTSAND